MLVGKSGISERKPVTSMIAVVAVCWLTVSVKVTVQDTYNNIINLRSGGLSHGNIITFNNLKEHKPT